MAVELDEVYTGFKDGFFTGIDILGFAFAHLTGDQRSIGYRADNYSLRLYDNFSYKARRSLLEEVAKGVGDVAGLAVNTITLGLANAMMLGEVYCVDEESRASIWERVFESGNDVPPRACR